MKGIVKDNLNKPFAFANVYVSDYKGVPVGNIGTITNYDGLFDFPFPVNSYITVSTAESSEKLTFYYVGKQFTEIILKRGYELSEAEIKSTKLKKTVNYLIIAGLIYTIFNN